MAKVILIGTSHKYQVFDKKADTNPIEKFRQLLIALCSKHMVQAIAEEMSPAGLAERGATKSVGFEVATGLNLKHQLSDPSPAVRMQLGICSEIEIQLKGFLNNWTQEQIKTKIQKSHSIREQYWLDQLRLFDTWPLLFVCGANHCKAFSTLLCDCELEVVVPFPDWEPMHHYS
jgi:hypothetical protein